MASLPTLQELPSARTALRWLLDSPAKATDRDVLVCARQRGLIALGVRGYWEADGAKMTRLLKAALRRLPRDPTNLGTLLHGLGEIDAHSHARFMEVLIDYLQHRRPRRPLIKVLNAAARCDSKTSQPVRFETLAFAQWISRAPFGWTTFKNAVHHLEHPYERFASRRFGLGFAARIILAVDPRSVAIWIATHPHHVALAAIGSAAISLAFPGGNPARILPLLNSPIAAIKCLAAASLIWPQDWQPSSLGYRECLHALVEGGIAPGDATWMTGFRLKQAIHQRYSLEHQRDQCDARLQYLERNLDAAIGGRHNAEVELRALRAQRNDASERYSKLLPDLETMLTDIAAAWPRDGLTDDQMVALENVFVDTPEFRYRLTERLPHSANRDWLLKRNIDQLRDFIGLKNPVEAFKDDFHLDEKRFAIIAPWIAQSLVLLYSGDKRGIGKRTSDLVSELAKASNGLLVQPFIAARRPEAWQSMVTRAACADLFVLIVVENVPQALRVEVAQLNEFAIERALTILCRLLPKQSQLGIFDQLTSGAVCQMALCQTPDDLRRLWGLTQDLPDFARALALWSSPALVERHKELASALFRRVGQLPLSNNERNQQFSRMLSLLDCAIAFCASGGRRDLISWTRWLWDEVYQDWRTITDRRWEHAATMLAAAVERDGEERVAVLADTTFARSYCRQLIGTAQQ